MNKQLNYIYDHPIYYDVLFGWDRSREILFVDQLANSLSLSGNRFLEIACGTGVVARQMAFLGWDVSGLDLSQAMVDAMNKTMQSIEKKTWAYCADMCDFDIKQEFELIYCPLGSIGLVHDEQKIIEHLSCVKKHLSECGRYVIDVGLQKSLTVQTQPLDLKDLIWAMEIEGIYVEASHGKVRVEDDMKDLELELLWDCVPLEFNFQHFKELIDKSGLKIQEIFPQSGTDESGIPVFDLSHKGYKEGIDRAMFVLS
jgi:SAM-dependent methyltransferase